MIEKFYKTIVLLFLTGPLFSQNVINQDNYLEKLKEFKVGDPASYKEKIRDFENASWGDLTFLNKYGRDKTGIFLYGMGNFGWGNQITGKARQVSELGIKNVRAMFADDDIFIKTAKAGIDCTLLLGGKYYSRGDTAGWKKSVEAAVKKYGRNGLFWKDHPELPPHPVKYYEILGETNIDSYTPPPGINSDKYYFEFLKDAYTIIKSIDPSAYVIAFGTAGGNIGTWFGISYYSQFDYEYKPGMKMKFYGWLRFIENVNNLGGYKYYDAIGLDCYSQPYGPDYKGNIVKALIVLRESMKKYGIEQKPVWFTEVGYPMKYRNDKYEYDDQKQADFTLRLYGLCASHGVEHVQSFHVLDFSQEGDPTSMMRLFGFFDKNGEVRKQGQALKTMISLLPEPRLLKTISDGQDNYYAYVFRGAGNKKVTMLWVANEETYKDNGILKYKKPEKSVEKIIQVKDKNALLVDIFGNRSPLEVNKGKAKVKVSPAPVFIVSK